MCVDTPIGMGATPERPGVYRLLVPKQQPGHYCRRESRQDFFRLLRTLNPIPG